ncbi:MAG: ABC-type antimicrobial peptide transport system, permease component, partial [uncultured Rubrobacteraceae bacterium]
EDAQDRRDGPPGAPGRLDPHGPHHARHHHRRGGGGAPHLSGQRHPGEHLRSDLRPRPEPDHGGPGLRGRGRRGRPVRRGGGEHPHPRRRHRRRRPAGRRGRLLERLGGRAGRTPERLLLRRGSLLRGDPPGRARRRAIRRERGGSSPRRIVDGSPPGQPPGGSGRSNPRHPGQGVRGRGGGGEGRPRFRAAHPGLLLHKHRGRPGAFGERDDRADRRPGRGRGLRRGGDGRHKGRDNRGSWRGRGLLGHHAGGAALDVHADHGPASDLPGGHRRHLSSRRGHRRDEHHARLRCREDPGDRGPKSVGRDERRRPAPVSPRSGPPRPPRRRPRGGPRRGGLGAAPENTDGPPPGGRDAGRGSPRLRGLGPDRGGLRRPPRLPLRPPRTRRGSKAGV